MNLVNIISKLLSSLVDGFKQKNPTVYTIILVVLLSIYAVINHLLGSVGVDGLPILNADLTGIVTSVRDVIVVLLGLLGAHTPQVVNNTKTPTVTA